MNINLDITAAVAIGGFIISSIVMWKSNKNGFAMIDLKISSVLQMITVELTNIKKDISNSDQDIEGLRDQLKSDIYPKLNSHEGSIKKNCQALEDHQKLCDLLRQNGKC